MSKIEILSVRDFARECGVSIGRVHHWITDGRLQVTRLGERSYWIERAEANRFLAERLAASALDPRIKIAEQSLAKIEKSAKSLAPLPKGSRRGKQNLASVRTGGTAMSAEKEKSASEVNRDAQREATLSATPSTDSWRCGVNGSITITATPAPAEAVQVAQDQPEDCFTVPQHSKHWRDTQQHAGGLRWQTNGRRSSR
jgi:hypothetical protein